MRDKLNTLSAHDASEGALYVMFAAILCLSPHSPDLIAVDNLDQALNPRLVTRLTERLIEWLRASDDSTSPDRRQLLFTAHNPAVLDGLDIQDDEVRLFDLKPSMEKERITRALPGQKISDERRELARDPVARRNPCAASCLSRSASAIPTGNLVVG